MKRKVSGGKHLNKEESLAFTKLYRESKRATAQDIQFYKEVYDREYAYKEKDFENKGDKNERNYMCIN